jgi:hypothetical protein
MNFSPLIFALIVTPLISRPPDSWEPPTPPAPKVTSIPSPTGYISLNWMADQLLQMDFFNIDEGSSDVSPDGLSGVLNTDTGGYVSVDLTPNGNRILQTIEYINGDCYTQLYCYDDNFKELSINGIITYQGCINTGVAEKAPPSIDTPENPETKIETPEIQTDEANTYDAENPSELPPSGDPNPNVDPTPPGDADPGDDDDDGGGGDGCGGDWGCVPAGTLFTTPYGQIPIEQITVGMEALAYDEITLKPVKAKVAKIFKYKDRLLCRLNTEHGSIIASHDHRIWCKEGKLSDPKYPNWPPIRDLEPNNITLWCLNGELVESKIISVEMLDKKQDVHHLTLDNGHIYVAGNLPAHNMEKDEI